MGEKAEGKAGSFQFTEEGREAYYWLKTNLPGGFLISIFINAQLAQTAKQFGWKGLNK